MVALTASLLIPSSTETAVANGDTRTLHLYHTHTGETIDATFRVNGHYDQDVLRQLNHFLRDWRNNDEHVMDPRLFDALWEAYRTAGATERIQIYSAYRSPETNAMLRRRSHAVAEHSQHMLGRAMDTTLPGFPMERVREAAMKLQNGGVGWYPSANFVHIDVGGVRSWPRMPYDQLARLFPDGKTVHIAADGRTLPGYEEARIQIAERGGGEVPPAQESKGFFAWLFGGGNSSSSEDEEERRAPAPAPVVVGNAPIPAAAPEPAAPESPRLQRAAEIKVASLATETGSSDAHALAVSAAPMPLPPPRPADLAVAAADVPLPPVRPVALDSTPTGTLRGQADADRANYQLASVEEGVTVPMPPERRANLPALITGKAPAPLPNQVLAFASPTETPSEFTRVPLPAARPSAFARSAGLRSARRHAATVAVPSAMAVGLRGAEPSLIEGPKLTGLRSAARRLELKAAL